MFENPELVLDSWLSRVNAGDLEGVLALYSEGAPLLPTFSDRIRTDLAGIRSYFEDLAGRENVRVTLERDSIVEQSLGNSFYALAGVYGWSFVEEGEQRQFNARFTFVINVGSDRPIVHHHSSFVPDA